MKQKVFSTYNIVTVGLLAAMIFAVTFFIKIGPIPTPAGPTMIKLANALCLLGGMLFGGVRGGLAAGIGSMLFDLSDPTFVASAPFTLVFFFLMAFVCGSISHAGGKNGSSFRLNLLAAIAGSLTYLVLYLSKSLIVLLLGGSSFYAALSACGVKLVTSGFNAMIAVGISVAIAPICREALIRAGLSKKLFSQPA